MIMYLIPGTNLSELAHDTGTASKCDAPHNRPQGGISQVQFSLPDQSTGKDTPETSGRIRNGLR